MNINVGSNFRLSVFNIQYSPNGDLCVLLACDEISDEIHYHYAANLGESQAEEKPVVSLSRYARDYASSTNIKPKTRDSYRLMCKHLESYGDCHIDKVTTAYLQGFIEYLQSQGMKPGTVRLYFQKLACVLHDAYKNELFDERVLLRTQ